MDTATANLDARLEQLSQQVTWLVARQEKQDELWSELMPIGRQMMSSLSGSLERAEQKGYLDFGRELLAVGERVLEHYTAEDVRLLGEAVVTILDTVRALTQPPVMAMASDAAQAMREADHVKPVGVFGAMRATHDEDVKRGIAVMLEVLKRIGHGVEAASTQAKAKSGDRRERLAQVLGPRKARAQAALPAVQRPIPLASAATVPRCSAAAPAAGAVAGDGLADATKWTRAVGQALAAEQGLSLTEAHWNVIDAARADYAQTRASPNIRRLTQIQPLGTKELYALFPKAPGRTIARIAGLPKPAGCI